MRLLCYLESSKRLYCRLKSITLLSNVAIKDLGTMFFQ